MASSEARFCDEIRSLDGMIQPTFAMSKITSCFTNLPLHAR